VGLALLLQPGTQRRGPPQDGGACHPRGRGPPPAQPLPHPPRPLRLGGQRRPLAAPPLAPSRQTAAQPFLRPLEVTVLEHLRLGGDQARIGHKDPDLAVLALARGPAVLPLTPADFIPFFTNPVSSMTRMADGSARCSCT